MTAETQATIRQLVNDFNTNHPVVWHRYMNDTTYHGQVELMIYILGTVMDEMRRHEVHDDIINRTILNTVTHLMTPAVNPDTVQPVTPVITLTALQDAT